MVRILELSRSLVCRWITANGLRRLCPIESLSSVVHNVELPRPSVVYQQRRCFAGRLQGVPHAFTIVTTRTATSSTYSIGLVAAIAIMPVAATPSSPIYSAAVIPSTVEPATSASLTTIAPSTWESSQRAPLTAVLSSTAHTARLAITIAVVTEAAESACSLGAT